jgi:hypothetical protein
MSPKWWFIFAGLFLVLAAAFHPPSARVSPQAPQPVYQPPPQQPQVYKLPRKQVPAQSQAEITPPQTAIGAVAPQAPQPPAQQPEPDVTPSVKLVGTNGPMVEYLYNYKWAVRVPRAVGWFDTSIPLIAGLQINLQCNSDKRDFAYQGIPAEYVPSIGNSYGHETLQFLERDDSRFRAYGGYSPGVAPDFEGTLRLKVLSDPPFLDIIVYWRDQGCSLDEGNPAHAALHAPARQWAREMIGRTM